MTREMSISDLAVARDEKVGELAKGLAQALDIIIWMSGSPSFSRDGEAYVGWQHTIPKLDELYDLLATVRP